MKKRLNQRHSVSVDYSRRASHWASASAPIQQNPRDVQQWPHLSSKWQHLWLVLLRRVACVYFLSAVLRKNKT